MVSIIINDDLLIRSYHAEDAAELYRVVDANREHLRPWMVWVDATQKPEHSMQFIQQSIQQANQQEGLALGIFYRNRIIGSMGMHLWDHRLRKAQIGYWITREFEGMGYIYLCAERFIGFLFQKLDLNKIELHYIPENKKSAAVAKRLGAKVEGMLRDSYLLNGRLHDLIITGILKKEWLQRRS